MLEPNFNTIDVHVQYKQERLKKMRGTSATTLIPHEQGRIRTAAGNLLIRWGERISGCERPIAPSPRERFVAS